MSFFWKNQYSQHQTLWCGGIVNLATWFFLEAMHFLRSVLTSSSHLQRYFCSSAFSSSHRLGCGNPDAQGSRGRGRSAAQTWRNAPAVPEHTKAAYLLWQAHAAENPCNLLCFVVLTYFSSTLRCSPLKQAGKKKKKKGNMVLLNTVILMPLGCRLSKEIGLNGATLVMLWRGREEHSCRNNKYDSSLKLIMFVLNGS